MILIYNYSCNTILYIWKIHIHLQTTDITLRNFIFQFAKQAQPDKFHFPNTFLTNRAIFSHYLYFVKFIYLS